jgi:5-methylcytosine-specific restriction endonuclease McrA
LTEWSVMAKRRPQDRFERSPAQKLVLAWIAANGWPDTSRSWWEADHIIEVVRGGGRLGLENFQTLCVPCHKAKTARLARERAQERRGITSTPDLFSTCTS